MTKGTKLQNNTHIITLNKQLKKDINSVKNKNKKTKLKNIRKQHNLDLKNRSLI